MNNENHKTAAPVHQLVGQLRELRERATPGPWAIANWGYTDDPHMVIEGPEIPNPATRDGFWFCGQKAVDWGAEWSAENAALIVAAVNALPALLAIAEAAALLSSESFVDDFGHWGVTDESYEALARALSLLPNAKADPAAVVGGSVSSDLLGHSRFHGHCRDCRHLNTCNLSPLPEGGCVNWDKPC